jgi:hypothetical protein
VLAPANCIVLGSGRIELQSSQVRITPPAVIAADQPVGTQPGGSFRARVSSFCPSLILRWAAPATLNLGSLLGQAPAHAAMRPMRCCAAPATIFASSSTG